MKLQLFAQVLAVSAIALGTIPTMSQPSYAQKRTFFCGTNNGVPTTMRRTSRGTNVPMIRWVDTSFPSPWTPERRCEEISAKLQTSLENGTINYLRSGWINGQPVLCVAGYKKGNCLPNGLIATLKPGTDPALTFRRLIDHRALASGRPITLSGDRTNDKLIFEFNGDVYFDVQKFLSEGDGSSQETNEPPEGIPWWER